MRGRYSDNVEVFLRSLLLFTLLFAGVLWFNMPIIRYDMMYVEQPTIYLANQSIHSLGDLLNVYLHPKLLDLAIPFFRPAGHFLIYKIIMPMLGWHNTRGMLIVSLSFVALIGLVMIRLYQLLFPGFYVGGYIAFGVYLMQPALMLSRLTVMHFDFAYVFFVMLSLYYFVLFCKKNHLLENYGYYSCDICKIKFHHVHLVFLSWLSFIIAVTFKEPALMLGPVVVSYLFIALYNRTPIIKWLWDVLKNKDLLQTMLLITITTLVLAVYLTLPWPTMVNPERHAIHLGEMWGAVKEFTQVIFSINQTVGAEAGLYSPGMVLRHIVVPVVTHVIMWMLIASSLAGIFLLLRRRINKQTVLHQKSVLFLLMASFFFLILPICWAAGLPWHLSLSLLFLSLIMGFGCEFLLRNFLKNKMTVAVVGIVSSILIASTTVIVDKVNIKYISGAPEGFAYAVSRNAVVNPPAIKDQLNADSVVVVEDSAGIGDYALGNGGYPFFLLDNFDYDKFNKKQRSRYVQYQLRYNGTLFRWAYLLPALKEEYFPFQVEEMAGVSDEAIYDWLQHFNNIFCLGYDKQGVWSDRTTLFKKNLLIEKRRRHLTVNQYHLLPAVGIAGDVLSAKTVSLPEVNSCQQQCDQDKHCKGLTYVAAISGSTKPTCYFYSSLVRDGQASCAICTSYIKKISA
jgi:hypothetical protein